MTRLNMPLGRVQGFLLKAGLKPKVVEVRSKQIIFAQGELGQCRVLYSQGCVRFTVTSKQRKNATIALLGPGDF